MALAVLLLCGCPNASKATQDEPEVKESAGAPVPQTDETRCATGDLEACRRQGVALTKSSPANAEAASSLFAKACDGGNASACSNLATSYMTGFGVKKDEAEAVKLFARACENKHALGCRNLGLAHLKGNGVPVDAAQAAANFQKACEMGAALSCTNWAMALRDGVGLDANEAKAAEVFAKACDQGDGTGCRHLGAMHAMGQGGLPRGDLSAMQWFSRACDAGDKQGCLALGVLQLDKDNTAARESLKKACDGKEKTACEVMVERGWATKSIESGTGKSGLPGSKSEPQPPAKP